MCCDVSFLAYSVHTYAAIFYYGGVVEHYADPHDGSDRMRLWLYFDDEHIGWYTRLKYRSHVRSKPDVLSDRWVPLEKRSTKLHPTKKITCRRIQFPITLACELTVHKPQGGTFEQVVYQYNKKHRQQLVYVALSRVTSLDGLFLTNDTNASKRVSNWD